MSLKARIENKKAHIGVLGLGYVGLPLAVEFAKAGFPVTGIDVDESKVAVINAGENYISDIADDTLKTLLSSGNLQATTDMDNIADLDAVAICVPTPLSKVGDPDISYIIAAVDGISQHIHKDLLIILESIKTCPKNFWKFFVYMNNSSCNMLRTTIHNFTSCYNFFTRFYQTTRYS